MKKILYIGNKLSEKGNTVSSIETLGVFLEQEGHQVYTASSKTNKIVRLNDMVYTTLRLRKSIDCVLIDTYSTQNFYYAVIIAFVCKTLKIPYIPILRGGDLPARWVKSKSMCNQLFKNAFVNIAPSSYLFNFFKNKGYDNLKYIPNTIELKNYRYLNRKVVSAKLLWVRSFSNIYNPLLALHIVEVLMKKKINVTLTMVGPEKDGSLEICKNYTLKHNLPVTFTGKLSKKEWITLSEQHDIFINTTNFDNTPVSVIEAMALGLPVISTNVGGLPFLIKDMTNGILVLPNDSEEFVNKIEYLISNNSKCSQISDNARKVAETFNWNKIKESWLKVLDFNL
ncbi:Glycosyl transferase, group 1 [unidentified eubacterium SCB49]|nr:Glycosyl transferase, group 1 [unidentified eubacterium SCB49]